MKQTVYIPLLYGGLLFLGTACSNSDEASIRDTSHPLRLTFQQAQTGRSIIESGNTIDKVGVYIAKADHTPYPGTENNGHYTFILSGGDWRAHADATGTGTATTVYLSAADDAMLCAFSPHNATLSQSGTNAAYITADLKATQEFDGGSATATDMTDYLYGSSSNTTGNRTPVTITAPTTSSGGIQAATVYMQHALARLVFRIKYAQSRQPDATYDFVKSVRITAASGTPFLTGTGGMQVTTGILTGTATRSLTLNAKAGTEVRPAAYGADLATTGTVAYGLAAPLTAAPGNVTLYITLGAKGDTSGDRTFAVTAPSFNVQWKSGYSYVYDLELHDIDIKVTSTDITDWDTASGSSTLPPDGYALGVRATIGGTAQSRATAAGSDAYDRTHFYENDRILIVRTRSNAKMEANYVLGNKDDWSPAQSTNTLHWEANSTYQGSYPVAHNGILADQRTAENFRMSNLMQTPDGITSNTQYIDLTGDNAFTHAYSRVSLIFKLEGNSTSEPSFTLGADGIQSGESAMQYIRMLRETESVSTGEYHYTAIIYPLTTGKRELKIALTYDGVSYTVTLDCACVKNTRYTYTLTIQNNILVPLKEEVNGWQDGGVISGELT